MTPLYKGLKESGTTFYAFPGASEDISAAYQNDNLTMNFSKFALLNIPKQVLSSGANNDPIKLDFSTFDKSSLTTPPTFSEQLVESLRNYVANQEATIRETKVGDNEFFYDNNELATTSERIFWKWCKKLNILDMENAIAQDEYFDDLDIFESNDLTDDTYFPEQLWKEREILKHRVVEVYQTGSTTNSGNIEMEFTGTTNLRVGDIVLFTEFSNSNLTFLNDTQLTILEIIPPTGSDGQKIIFEYAYTAGLETETTGVAEIVYEQLVTYIGEITALNNVQEANRSYTEVYAHIGAHLGKTPDILFRTISDDNYSPNLQYPILPSQYQPEIIGAENFNSPIVNNPTAYPGDQFGQFDNPNFYYKNANGDTLRRSGDYYGLFGDTNNTIIDPSNLDGLSIDFDPNHYVKMNIINREVSTFDEFNALAINNEPPKDFEFNAVLWYYTVEDNNGNQATNLYGITVLDNPNNNPNPNLAGLKIPTYKKLVNDGTKDGLSYSLSLNLNFNIINDSIQPSFNPDNVNSLFSFNLFNEAMTRLASTNDSFNNVIAKNNDLALEIQNIKQLIYTQTDLSVINKKIRNLETLLNMYQTMQLVSTDTVQVLTNNTQSPPTIELNAIDSQYVQIDNIDTTDLYTANGIIPNNISVPSNKDFLITVTNNDEIDVQLNDNLTIVLDSDLSFKQSANINIDATDNSKQNKKLDIYIMYDSGVDEEVPEETLILSDIDLPIFYNENEQRVNSAKTWTQSELKVDLSKDIQFDTGDILRLPMDSNIGMFKGDTYVLNNFIIGATVSNDFSGQYLVDTVDVSSNYIDLDISNNIELLNYVDTLTTLPYTVHGLTASELNSQPFLSLNKGYNFTITRISDDDTTALLDRYQIKGGSI